MQGLVLLGRKCFLLYIVGPTPVCLLAVVGVALCCVITVSKVVLISNKNDETRTLFTLWGGHVGYCRLLLVPHF
jgi:hypothetical protein